MVTSFGYRLISVALAGTAILGAISGCRVLTGHSAATPSPTCVSTGPVPQLSDAPADAAPGGGGLRVVESAVRLVGQGESHHETLSMGAIVQNTSDHAAYRVVVTLTPRSADGQRAAAGTSYQLNVFVPVILPGARVPIGMWAYPARLPNYQPLPPNDLQVSFGTVHWVADVHRFAAVSATITRRVPARGPEGTAGFYYTARIDSCQPLPSRGVVVIYRDASGALVGGSMEFVGKRLCTSDATEFLSGFQGGVPQDFDIAHTEVYPYCDPESGPYGPSPSGPFN